MLLATPNSDCPQAEKKSRSHSDAISKIPHMSKTKAQEKKFRLKLWFRLAAFWIVVMVVGFAVSFYVLPYGALWLAGVADQTITANYGR